MIYAGFWKRLLSLLIDAAVFLPVALIIHLCQSISKQLFISTHLFSLIIGIAYFIVLHAIFGQTVGKRLAKIKVVTLSGEDIDWKISWLRHSVDGILSIWIFIAETMSVLAMSDEVFKLSSFSLTSPEYIQFGNELRDTIPMYALGLFSLFWTYSGLIVLLFNEKKRTIHDFIAKTVVIDLEKSK